MKRSFLMSDELENSPYIICVAITESVPGKADNPTVPITIPEQIESTHAAFEASASIAHCHARDDEGKPTSDLERLARLKHGIETHCRGMIIQLSPGGRPSAGRARGGMLPLSPDMASLSVDSNNFPARVYENPPDLVAGMGSAIPAQRSAMPTPGTPVLKQLKQREQSPGHLPCIEVPDVVAGHVNAIWRGLS